jgi:hypothetical protein
MHCYEFHDRVSSGIRLGKHPAPHVPVYPSERAFDHELLLDDALVEFLAEMRAHLPEDDMVLRFADVRLDKKRAVLTPPATGSDRQALVRVQTWSGSGGTIALKGPRNHPDFPPPGVGVLLAGRTRTGSAEILDTLLVLAKGSELRIVRSGALEGAWSSVLLTWDGARLKARDLR